MYTGPNIPTNGLVLSLDAANTKSYVSGSTTWRDLSGNNYSATKAGTLSPTYPLWNSQGYFTFLSGSNGTNESRFTTNQNIQAFSALSVFAWYRTSTLNSANTILRMQNDDFGIVANSANQIRWHAGSAYTDINVLILIPTTNNGVWHNTGFTYDGDNLKAYFDSNNVGNASRGSVVTTQAGLLNIGTRNDSFAEHFAGDISIISIYNRVLSPEEISQIYNSQKSRFGL